MIKKALRIITLIVRPILYVSVILTYSIFSLIIFSHAVEILSKIKDNYGAMIWEVRVVEWTMIVAIIYGVILLMIKLPSGINTKNRGKKKF